jgi:hypothetical protein
MDQLDEQKIISLLTYVLSNVMGTHMCSYTSPTIKAWLLVHPSTLSLFCPHAISL